MHAVLLQDALVVQLDAAIESGLSAHGNDDAIGLLASNDLLDEIGSDREEEHLGACGGGTAVERG